jgi:hypothetical protein
LRNHDRASTLSLTIASSSVPMCIGVFVDSRRW